MGLVVRTLVGDGGVKGRVRRLEMHLVGVLDGEGLYGFGGDIFHSVSRPFGDHWMPKPVECWSSGGGWGGVVGMAMRLGMFCVSVGGVGALCVLGGMVQGTVPALPVDCCPV